MNRTPFLFILAGYLIASTGFAQEHNPAMHAHHMSQEAPPADLRTVVQFPPAMRQHILANMRDHLLALQQIQAALAKQAYDEASEIAENRLGMSSLRLHGAHESSKFMPEGMQSVGTAMHRHASRLALDLKDTAVTQDMKPVLEALSNVTAQCVACHAGYRVQ